MKVHLLSDLHLEFGDMPRSYTPPACDVVVLAGDIATGVAGVMWAASTFDVPVIYVPGNHEFYGKRRYARHIEKMKAKAAGTNVHVLTDDYVDIAGARFVGATLWTDFDLYGQAPIHMPMAQQKMNDYVQILQDIHQPMQARYTAAYHKQSRFYIGEVLREPFDGPKIVVTHHAPSELSIHPRWRNHPLTPAYASRLEYLIFDRKPALWLHGHLHDSVDYVLDDTRVVCNPRGYVGHELNDHFDPGLVLEV